MKETKLTAKPRVGKGSAEAGLAEGSVLVAELTRA